MRNCLFAATMIASTSSAAGAQNYGSPADQDLVYMLNSMIAISQQQCQMGNAASCANIPGLQRDGQMVLQAGQDCSMGNQQACSYYYSGAQQIQMAYASISASAPTYDPGFMPSTTTGSDGPIDQSSFINGVIWERDNATVTVESGSDFVSGVILGEE